MAELRRILDEGMGFFHNLARYYKPAFGFATVNPGPPEPERQLCHDALTYLGDLSRYKESLLSKQPDWEVPRMYYLQAHLVSPPDGKPQSQLGLLASFERKGLETVYRYCLSLATTVPFSPARNNLLLFFNSQKDAPPYA